MLQIRHDGVDGQFRFNEVVIRKSELLLAASGKSLVVVRPARATMRDAAHRHVTLARVAMDACCVRRVLLPDENAAAYGEIVWSWRRDPGATPAEFMPTTGARKAASPGRARISRKTIARGKPGCLGCTCQNRVHSCLNSRTRRCGCIQRPAFPAPSVLGGTTNWQSSGGIAP